MSLFLDSNGILVAREQSVAPLVLRGPVDAYSPPPGPQYFSSYIDENNVFEADDGVTKDTGGNVWDGVARTFESWSDDRGIEITITSAMLASETTLQLQDASIATGTNWYTPSQATFTAMIDNGWSGEIRTYYANSLQATAATGVIAGDVLKLRRKSGSIEALLNDSAIYTFVQEVPASIYGRVTIKTVGLAMAEMRDVA